MKQICCCVSQDELHDALKVGHIGSNTVHEDKKTQKEEYRNRSEKTERSFCGGQLD